MTFTRRRLVAGGYALSAVVAGVALGLPVGTVSAAGNSIFWQYTAIGLPVPWLARIGRPAPPYYAVLAPSYRVRNPLVPVATAAAVAATPFVRRRWGRTVVAAGVGRLTAAGFWLAAAEPPTHYWVGLDPPPFHRASAATLIGAALGAAVGRWALERWSLQPVRHPEPDRPPPRSNF